MYSMWNPFAKKKPIAEAKMAFDEYNYAQSSAYDAMTFGADQGIFAYNVGDAAIPSSIFMRVIALIAGKCPELITNSLKVIDNKGQPSNRSTALLTETPDRIMPAYTFLADCFRDLSVAGNCIIVVRRNSAGTPTALARLMPNTATSYRTQDGYVYTGQEAYGLSHRTYSEQDIVHASWPLRRDNSTVSNSDRGNFSEAPVKLLRKNISTAVDLDTHIYNYFQEPVNKLRANLVASDDFEVSNKQRKDLANSLSKLKKPFFVPINELEKVEPVTIEAQTEATRQLRIFQLEEIARVYGIPGPLFGISANAVAGSIAELSRLAWRYGFSLHINYLLKALEYKLLPKGYRYHIDPSAMLKGELDPLASAITKLVGGSQNPGVVTINESRYLLGLPRLPDSKYDKLYEFVQANQQKPSDNGENNGNNA